MTWHGPDEHLPGAAPARHVAIFDRGVLALRRRCSTRTSRLETVVEALTESSLGERVGVLLIRDLTFNMFDHDPDEVLDTIADLCRPHGLHITTDPPSASQKPPKTPVPDTRIQPGVPPGSPPVDAGATGQAEHPDQFECGCGNPAETGTSATSVVRSRYFTVRTDYAPDTVVREHFETAEDRRQSLLERADILMSRPNMIPPMVLAVDERLAGLISLFIEPATVSLSETTLEQSRPQPRPRTGS